MNFLPQECNCCIQVISKTLTNDKSEIQYMIKCRIIGEGKYFLVEVSNVSILLEILTKL